MEGIALLKDHRNGASKKVYNPVVLYCSVNWKTTEFNFPLDLDLWKQQSKRAKSKKQTNSNHKKRWEYGFDMLSELLDFLKTKKYSLEGLELAVDNGYCVDEFFNLLDQTPVKYVATPKSTNSFEINGKSYNLRAHSRMIKDWQWKRSSKYSFRYFKCNGIHSKYGTCTILFMEKIQGGKVTIDYLISNATSIRVDSLVGIFKRRWRVEVFFRNEKQILSFGNYSGRKLRGVLAHYFLRMISGIVVSMTILTIFNNKKFKKYFKEKKITYGDVQTFISEHYKFQDIT